MLGNKAARGARLIAGPAGSGKTTLLRERYVELVRAGERGILLLVGSRRAARALGERILSDIGASTDQVRVSTWHAFALSLLRAHHRRLGYTREPGLLTGPEQFTLVREMLETPEEQRHWSAFPRQVRLAGFVEELRELVLRAQDALRSPEELAEAARLARRPDLEQAALFFRRYLDRIDARDDAVVDHANAIARAWQLVREHDDVAVEVRRDTRHLLVDDLQDVTPAQLALLRELFVEGGSVTVAANPDARVYGFRGSAPDAIERFKQMFPPVSDVVLDQNHRGEPARDAWLFDHLTEEAEAIARECRRLRAREGIGWGRIAVVVRRYGACSRAIRRAFERAGVPFVVVGENRPLARETALAPMLELARAALHAGERDDLLPGLLASPAVGLDPYDARALRREARVRGASLSALVREPPDDLPEGIGAKLRELQQLFGEIADRDASEPRPDGVFWFLWERLAYFREMVARGDEAELDAVAAFARAIERFSDRRPGKRFGDYLAALAGVEFGPEPWSVPEERRADAVRLMTAHHAVGEEFDAVIVAGCTEGEFPDLHQPRAMLDLRDLLAPGTADERARARLDAERRLFGVATTRARRRLLVTAARESSQREATPPSPFLHLLGLEWGAPPPAPEPLTRDEAEAMWRRTLADRGAADDARSAAREALARLPGVRPETWWYEHDWTENDRPLAGEEFLGSYSRLSPYENCPLQYLYQKELGLDPEQTHYMLVGSWIHDIVDRCAKGEVERTEEALTAELERLWRPRVFPSNAVEHRLRIECVKMLKRWLDSDAKVEPLATEVHFEFAIDGARLHGYIDRLVRCSVNSVRVIDYKTGASWMTESELADDLQLGTYYLAMLRDPELVKLGEPMRLELVYLATEDRRFGGYKNPAFDPRKIPDYEQAMERRLLTLIEGIRAEEFAPRSDAECRNCKFKTLCPVWPQGDEVRLYDEVAP